MCFDAAIGDEERAAIRHDGQIMRADTAGLKCAKWFEAVCCIIEANDAVARFYLVFRGVEDAPIR